MLCLISLVMRFMEIQYRWYQPTQFKIQCESSLLWQTQTELLLTQQFPWQQVGALFGSRSRLPSVFSRWRQQLDVTCLAVNSRHLQQLKLLEHLHLELSDSVSAASRWTKEIMQVFFSTPVQQLLGCFYFIHQRNDSGFMCWFSWKCSSPSAWLRWVRRWMWSRWASSSRPPPSSRTKPESISRRFYWWFRTYWDVSPLFGCSTSSSSRRRHGTLSSHNVLRGFTPSSLNEMFVLGMSNVSRRCWGRKWSRQTFWCWRLPQWLRKGRTH